MGNLAISMRSLAGSFGFFGRVLFQSDFGEAETEENNGNLSKLVKKESPEVQRAVEEQTRNAERFASLTVDNHKDTFGPSVPKEDEDEYIRVRRSRKGNNSGPRRKKEGAITIRNYDAELAVAKDSLDKDVKSVRKDANGKNGKVREQRDRHNG